ncbi:fimbria/pilus periplasmic chaperone [Kluyvera intermedia]|jgi:P pilus assembly chaperone PapD|uniref:Fimbria/pilus periplasmic chaperone n=1 Tax=Kluyvera intermedia TaxID=61648 RepID=A0ABX6DM21_KLUIN|nr:fimbria/pilus periplasmic chaperone [Kluyvera intermedia]QGH29835.1 fimbria/pilus periplasmic chaperone [Kluyvera intermedia]QGH38817.1 fimbria/pilus periplasmic chaperone [Kluyvera intermedia]WEJ85258.1 MAG: fimbria/pilus periplasmic chaperone [Kluyvera intermedia]
MKYHLLPTMVGAALCCALVSHSSQAAVTLDRTRAVFDGANKSMSLNITNQNKALPYLAQAWIEDESGNKLSGPIVALPPLQRVESLAKGQVKLQLTDDARSLPQDRESIFYFNLREIPPKSSKANTLQIALQTRIKLFYRPAALQLSRGNAQDLWQKKLVLTRRGQGYRVSNPSPYYVTLAAAYTQSGGKPVTGFDPVMIAPFSESPLTVKAGALGDKPVLTWINDYGGRPKLMFSCLHDVCRVVDSKAG